MLEGTIAGVVSFGDRTAAIFQGAYEAAVAIWGSLPGAIGDFAFQAAKALLHKSAVDRTSPFPGQTYPATSVTGVPRAVNPLSTATRTWNSAT